MSRERLCIRPSDSRSSGRAGASLSRCGDGGSRAEDGGHHVGFTEPQLLDGITEVKPGLYKFINPHFKSSSAHLNQIFIRSEKRSVFC